MKYLLIVIIFYCILPSYSLGVEAKKNIIEINDHLSAAKIDFSLLHTKFNEKKYLKMREGKFIRQTDPIIGEKGVFRFSLGFHRIWDGDGYYSFEGGDLMTGNSIFNIGVGFAFENEFPYFAMGAEYSPMFDIFITDSGSRTLNRFSGSMLNYNVQLGMNFGFIRLNGIYQESTLSLFNKESKPLKIVFYGIGTNFGFN